MSLWQMCHAADWRVWVVIMYDVLCFNGRVHRHVKVHTS
jgi:hypothetical protein